MAIPLTVREILLLSSGRHELHDGEVGKSKAGVASNECFIFDLQ